MAELKEDFDVPKNFREQSKLSNILGGLKRKIYRSWQNLRSSRSVFKKELSSCTWSG